MCSIRAKCDTRSRLRWVNKCQSFLPSATKLWQGNIFTSVCQEFCPRGGVWCLPQCMLGYTTPSPGRYPLGRHPPADTPLPRRRLLQRTVRILLECILVILINLLVVTNWSFEPLFFSFAVTYRWIKLPVPKREDPQYCVVPYQRYGHTVVGFNESAYIWGGRNDIDGACDTLYCFDAS